MKPTNRPEPVAGASGRPPGRFRRSRGLFLLAIPVAVAWAAHGYVRDLTFQLDDHELILDAGSWPGRFATALALDGGDSKPVGLLSRLFRPVVWSTFVIESRLFRQPFDPRSFPRCRSRIGGRSDSPLTTRGC